MFQSILVGVVTQSRMRQNPLNLMPTAVFIPARRPHIPNYHIIVQNKRENQIPGDSDRLCEI